MQSKLHKTCHWDLPGFTDMVNFFSQYEDPEILNLLLNVGEGKKSHQLQDDNFRQFQI